LPLWPPPMAHAALTSFVQQLPQCAAHGGGVARALAGALANAPKSFAAEQCAALLRGVTAHGALVLKPALQRADVSALLLGVLCRATDQTLDDLVAFYGLLLPLAASSEHPWALLNAVLPTVDAAHAAIIQMALTSLQAGAMGFKCAEAHAAFGQRLQAHLASLA